MQPLRAASPPAFPEDAAVLLEIAGQLAQEVHPGRRRGARLTLDSSLERDAGLDSLGRVELFLRLERRLGASLPESLLAEAETIQDLLAALRTAPRAREGPSRSAVAAVTPPAPFAVASDARTLLEVLRWHAQARPEQVHLRLDEGGELRSLTYGALLEGASVVARGLLACGVRPRQAVALMLPTGLDYFHAFFGALLIGAIPVPLYPPARMSLIAEHLRRQARILADAEAVVLVTAPEVQRLGFFMTSLVEGLRRIVTPAELTALASASSAAIDALPAPEPHDVALLQYTSGSTGDPKGVVLTHANLLANVRAMGEAIEIDSRDVMVSWLPLYHDMGLIGAWLGSLYHGMPLVLMSPLRFLSRPARWLWAIHAHRGTLSPAPNFAYELCASRIGDDELAGLDLGSWRMALNGAEPVSPATLRRFCERFARYGFRRDAMAPVYGLAECSVGLTFPPPGRGPAIDRVQRTAFTRAGRAIPAEADDAHALEVVGSGRPLPGHEIRVVDASGHELADREQGRLQFRGPSATSGYLRNPAANQRLFDGDWLESGDLGYVADGEVYVTGRSKDVILRAGRNVHPHELEDAIGRVEGVRRGCVAAFGVPDPAAGTERIVVVAETRATDAAERERVRDAVSAVATALLEAPPDDVVLAAPRSVPKTTSGKLRRSACREAYERGMLRAERGAPLVQLLGLAAEGIGSRLRRGARTLSAVAYAAYAWASFGAVAPIAWLVIVAMPRAAQAWAVLRATARVLLWLSGTRLHVERSEDSVLRRARVVVSNHASYLDGLVLAAALPWRVRFVVKAELARSWVTRIPLDRLQVIYVERAAAAQSVADAQRARAAIEGSAAPLLYFPEGTVKRAPGLLPFHLGAFMAAAEAGVPLLPLVVRGTRSKLRPGGWFLRRGSVEVRFGPLLAPEGSDFEAALRLCDAARRWTLASSGDPDHG